MKYEKKYEGISLFLRALPLSLLIFFAISGEPDAATPFVVITPICWIIAWILDGIDENERKKEIEEHWKNSFSDYYK